MAYFDTYAKRAFVRTVLQGLPKPDELRDQLISLLQAHAKSLMPKALRNAMAAGAAVEPWINMERVHFPNWREGVSFVTHIQRDGEITLDSLPEDKAEQARELLKGIVNREQAIDRCKCQLEASLASCRTIAAAHKRMPEFSHLLPKEDEKTASLPTTNIVDTLKKFGWVDPRESKKAA